MKDRTVFVYLLILSYICVSCAMTSGILDYGSVAAGYYVEGKKAELNGDFEKALEYYKKSLDLAKGSKFYDDLGYVPVEYLPYGYTGGSVSRARLEYNVISDAYQRVYKTGEYNVIEKAENINSPAAASQSEFKLKGHIKDENGKPLLLSPVFFETYWKTDNRSANTNHQGEFIISIKESGTLHIDANKNQPIYENIKYDVIFIKDKGVLEIDGKIYKPNDVLSIVVQYNALGRMMKASFESIVACNTQGASECVINEGKNYIQKYGGVDWEEIQRIVMANEFKNIIKLNKNIDYEAIISGGKEYIEQYRNISDSKWEEVEKLVKEAAVVKEFSVIKNLSIEENYKSIILQGKEYIEKYRTMKDSKWEEIEKLVKEAEVVKREKEFLAIKTLTIKEDYESIISQGKDYIEQYRNVASSQWKEIANLVSKAEKREKQVEEEERKREERERIGVIVEELCQNLNSLAEVNEALQQSYQLDIASGTVNLYEKRKLTSSKMYLGKEIERLKREFTKLGGGTFLRNKNCKKEESEKE